MIDPFAKSPQPAAAQPNPLPLAWFEFTQSAMPARWYHPDLPGAAPATWTVEIDGRTVPFKFLRKLPAPSQCRPVLLLLHGMGVTVATYHGIAPYLFRTHDLLLVDYNSFSVVGGWPPGGVTMRLLAAGAWKAVDAIAVRRVSLAGASLGGGLAMLATLQRPDAVRRIVLFNPAVYPQSLPRMYNVARTPILGEAMMWVTPPERFSEGMAWVGYSAPEKMPAELRRIYTENLRRHGNRVRLMDVMRQIPGSPLEMREQVRQLGAIQQEIFVVWGCQDRLVDGNTARRLAADLPHVSYREFPALAHAPHEEAPEVIGPVVEEFLRGDAETEGTLDLAKAGDVNGR